MFRAAISTPELLVGLVANRGRAAPSPGAARADAPYRRRGRDGPEGRPVATCRVKSIAAASLAEWEAAQQAGTLRDYEAIFGATAEVPAHEWDAHEPHDLTVGEFETVWLTARAACQARARVRPTHRT